MRSLETNNNLVTPASFSLPRRLPIAQIRRDGGTQPRAGLDEDAINDYVAALASDAEFPAIFVMFDGEDYWLFDGFHRIEAHLRSGRTEIKTCIYKGTLEDAQWLSYGANKDHGLRRSTADKERAIRAALQHAQAQGMTSVALAKHLGVSDKTVTKYREQMQAVSEIPTLGTREGSDGKQYPVNRKRPAPAAPAGDRSLTPGNVFKAVPGDPDSMDVHVMSFTAALPSAPTLRPLTLDETMSLVWRVVKAARLPIATTPATTGQRWRQYREWLSRYTVAADYSHEAPAGTVLGHDGQTLADARLAIMAELDKNIGMVRGVGEVAASAAEGETVQLPPFPVEDKALFVEQCKRSIRLLDEEGCATVAGFLRSICRQF